MKHLLPFVQMINNQIIIRRRVLTMLLIVVRPDLMAFDLTLFKV